MSEPPTGDKYNKLEDDKCCSEAEEVDVSMVTPRGFDDRADVTEQTGIDIKQATIYKETQYDNEKGGDDAFNDSSNKLLTPRRRSSSRFSHAKDGFENLIRDSQDGLFEFAARRTTPPYGSWLKNSRPNFDCTRILFLYSKNSEARQLGGRFEGVPSAKNGYQWYGSNADFASSNLRGQFGHSKSTRFLKLENCRNTPAGSLFANSLDNCDLGYATHEVYPPWTFRIPGMLETAKAFATYSTSKAFGEENPAQNSSQPQMAFNGRQCVICYRQLPLDDNGDTCCFCGGKICKQCVLRRRVHIHHS